MNRLLHDMAHLALVALLPLLLALAPAKAQTVVYQGATTPLTVVEVPGHTYEWEIYSDSTVNFATVSGNCPVTSAIFTGGNTGSSVNVTWLLPGIYFYKVTALDANLCTMNLKIGMIKVIPIRVDAVIAGAIFTGACQQVKLDASKSIGDIIKYEWSVLDHGGTLTSQTGITTEFLFSPSFTGSLPTDFEVRLQVTNHAGKTDSDTINIKVDRLPFADIYSNGQPEKDGSMIVDGTISSGTTLNYRWYTSEGKIIGPDNQSTAKLLGVGIYNLEVIDIHGCKSTKTFRFPIDLFRIIANPDYVRTSWVADTTVIVLANDQSTVNLIPGTVRIIEPPSRGETKVNPDGTITYIPTNRVPGRDQFVYEVYDAINLSASATVTIDIYDASPSIPEAFSPNGDGLNDHLKIKGLENYPKSQIHIYTRSGQLVYQSEDYLNDWDGRTIKSILTNLELVPTGTYYYVLKLGSTTRTIKGFVYIGY